MKKKILKIAALSLAIVLIISVLMFANSLVGNPVSKALAENTAKRHLASEYADTDYELKDVNYSLKDGMYWATVSSPSSADTTFSLLINGFGKLKYDNYDFTVTSRWSTAQRLDREYREVVKALLDSNSFPYNEYIGYGELTFTTSEEKESTSAPDYAIITNDLVLDAYYNVGELGKEAGIITVMIEDDNVSYEHMAEILLGIRESFDKAGVGFYAIDCVLDAPMTEDGAYGGERIEVVTFLYSDIHEDGLVERVEDADEAARDYFGFTKEDSVE